MKSEVAEPTRGFKPQTKSDEKISLSLGTNVEARMECGAWARRQRENETIARNFFTSILPHSLPFASARNSLPDRGNLNLIRRAKITHRTPPTHLSSVNKTKKFLIIFSFLSSRRFVGSNWNWSVSKIHASRARAPSVAIVPVDKPVKGARTTDTRIQKHINLIKRSHFSVRLSSIAEISLLRAHFASIFPISVLVRRLPSRRWILFIFSTSHRTHTPPNSKILHRIELNDLI